MAKIPKKVLDVLGKTTKKGESVIGKGAKIGGLGAAGGAGYAGIEELVKKVTGKSANDDQKDENNQTTANDNESSTPVVPGGVGLPTNVIPFRVNKPLHKDLVPDKATDSEKLDILITVVDDLKMRVEHFEKVEHERQQAEALAEQERKLEEDKKPKPEDKEHVSGKTKAKLKSAAMDAIGPMMLGLLMSMGTLKKEMDDAFERLNKMDVDFSELGIKLAAAGIPGFAVASMTQRIVGKIKEWGKSKLPSKTPESPKVGATETAKESAKAKQAGAAANDNKPGYLKEKLTKLKAPPWVMKILDKAVWLSQKVTSRIPLIGFIVDVIFNVLDEYNPDIHKDPNEFQKLLISSIVRSVGHAISFVAIIGLFTLLGGPLGTLAGILVYVLAEDKIDDVIKQELIGYLVKYVFFDEDPVEAAKKSGRYKSYERQKEDADRKLKEAQANLKVIENQEARGETLLPEQQARKKAIQEQIKGYEGRKEKLDTAKREMEVEAQQKKTELEAAKKAAGQEPAGTGRADPLAKSVNKATDEKPPVDFGDLSALKKEISSGEGGYGSFNKGRAGDSGNSKEFDLQNMTVAEVMEAQRTKGLFAVGKYQFIPNTLREAVKNTPGIDVNAKFNSETQEKLFPYLISSKKGRPNVDAYLQGKSDNVDAALNDLAYEFASIPDNTGKGKYDGDSAGNAAAGGLKRAERIKAILKATRESIASGQNKPKEPFVPSNAAPGDIKTDEFAKLGPAGPAPEQIKLENTDEAQVPEEFRTEDMRPATKDVTDITKSATQPNPDLSPKEIAEKSRQAKAKSETPKPKTEDILKKSEEWLKVMSDPTIPNEFKEQARPDLKAHIDQVKEEKTRLDQRIETMRADDPNRTPPAAPPVVVLPTPPTPKQANPKANEPSDTTAPSEIPSPVASDRPTLNMAYKMF